MIVQPSSAPNLRQTLALSRAILPLMAAVCIAGAGNGLLTTVVSLHLSGGHFSAVAVQIILSGFPMGFLAGGLVTHGIVARLGHERTFRILALLTALVGVCFALSDQAVLWFLLRLINGVCMAVLFIVAESWINLYAGPSNRGTLFSLYMLMTSLSVLLGQLMVRLADPQGVSSAGGSSLYGTPFGGIQAGYEHYFPSRLMLGIEVDGSLFEQLDNARVLSYRATATGDRKSVV